MKILLKYDKIRRLRKLRYLCERRVKKVRQRDGRQRRNWLKQERVKKMVLRIIGILFLAFSASRLGIFGVTSYNIFRLLFGSLAYLLIVGAFVYFLFPNQIRNREGTISGFWLIVAGLLLEFHAYFDWNFKGNDLFNQTLKLALRDLSSFKVSEFFGGGLVGNVLYLPVSFLFSN
jgi:S-DNA-T family DNA segregation ATPase FtsK/SpoIIIE